MGQTSRPRHIPRDQRSWAQAPGLGRHSYPTGRPLYPTGRPSYPIGRPSYPVGRHSYPVGRHSYPRGRHSYPAGKPMYPTSGRATGRPCACTTSRDTEISQLGRTQRQILETRAILRRRLSCPRLCVAIRRASPIGLSGMGIDEIPQGSRTNSRSREANSFSPITFPPGLLQGSPIWAPRIGSILTHHLQVKSHQIHLWRTPRTSPIGAPPSSISAAGRQVEGRAKELECCQLPPTVQWLTFACRSWYRVRVPEAHSRPLREANSSHSRIA